MRSACLCSNIATKRSTYSFRTIGMSHFTAPPSVDECSRMAGAAWDGVGRFSPAMTTPRKAPVETAASSAERTSKNPPELWRQGTRRLTRSDAQRYSQVAPVVPALRNTLKHKLLRYGHQAVR